MRKETDRLAGGMQITEGPWARGQGSKVMEIPKGFQVGCDVVPQHGGLWGWVLR